MEDIVVIGGGGHSKVVISILRKLSRFRILGYTDLKNNGTLLSVPYLGDDREFAALISGREVSAAIGVGQVGLGTARAALWMRMQPLKLSLPAIVSPHAVVNDAVDLGNGTVVMDGAVINSGAVTGIGAIVNTGSIVEHDVILGDWVHVAPGATISGGSKIGAHTMIGVGAVVIEGRSITADCIIGAGSTVISDITIPGVYVGSPVRKIR
jgi:sugar O-acyltransferase (sialic acid O-acetyltransferase NeuD family)